MWKTTACLVSFMFYLSLQIAVPSSSSGSDVPGMNRQIVLCKFGMNGTKPGQQTVRSSSFFFKKL